MKRILCLLTALVLTGCSAIAGATPTIGIIRDHGKGWRLYVLEEKLSNGEKLFILSPEGGRKVTCCAIVTSSPFRNTQDAPFVSDADEAGSTKQELVYDISIPEHTFSGINGLAIVVRAKSVAMDGKEFVVIDADGKSYKADSCTGSEGINVYLYRKTPRELLTHYYGNLGYGIAGGDCDRLH